VEEALEPVLLLVLLPVDVPDEPEFSVLLVVVPSVPLEMAPGARLAVAFAAAVL